MNTQKSANTKTGVQLYSGIEQLEIISAILTDLKQESSTVEKKMVLCLFT